MRTRKDLPFRGDHDRSHGDLACGGSLFRFEEGRRASTRPSRLRSPRTPRTPGRHSRGGGRATFRAAPRGKRTGTTGGGRAPGRKVRGRRARERIASSRSPGGRDRHSQIFCLAALRSPDGRECIRAKNLRTTTRSSGPASFNSSAILQVALLLLGELRHRRCRSLIPLPLFRRQLLPTGGTAPGSARALRGASPATVRGPRGKRVSPGGDPGQSIPRFPCDRPCSPPCATAVPYNERTPNEARSRMSDRFH